MTPSDNLAADLERLAAIRLEMDAMDPFAPDTMSRIYQLNNELRPLHLRVFGHAKERITLKRHLRLHGIPYDQEAPMADLVRLASLVPSS